MIKWAHTKKVVADTPIYANNGASATTFFAYGKIPLFYAAFHAFLMMKWVWKDYVFGQPLPKLFSDSTWYCLVFILQPVCSFRNKSRLKRLGRRGFRCLG